MSGEGRRSEDESVPTFVSHERRLNTHAERLRALEDFRLLHQTEMTQMRENLRDIKGHLNEQDTKLDDIKTTINRWAGAVAVIIAIPALFSILWQVFHK